MLPSDDTHLVAVEVECKNGLLLPEQENANAIIAFILRFDDNGRWYIEMRTNNTTLRAFDGDGQLPQLLTFIRRYVSGLEEHVTLLRSKPQ